MLYTEDRTRKCGVNDQQPGTTEMFSPVNVEKFAAIFVCFLGAYIVSNFPNFRMKIHSIRKLLRSLLLFSARRRRESSYKTSF